MTYLRHQKYRSVNGQQPEMSDTVKVTHLRTAYEIMCAQAKESGRLDDSEMQQNFEKVSDILAFLELSEWKFDSDNFESGAFLDEWWRRYKIAEKAGVPMEPWQECFDKYEKSLDEVGRDLDGIVQDLKEIEEGMARCKEQDSDVETDEDGDSNEGEATASDCYGGTPSVCEAANIPALRSEELQHPSTLTPSVSSPFPDITLEGIGHQTYLLRDALAKSLTALHPNCDMACTMLCMLEAYNARSLLLVPTSQFSVFSISTNLDGAQAAFETLKIPETHVFSIVMEALVPCFWQTSE